MEHAPIPATGARPINISLEGKKNLTDYIYSRPIGLGQKELENNCFRVLRLGLYWHVGLYRPTRPAINSPNVGLR